MTDIFHVLPDFLTKPFSHILPSLDKNLIATSDLITLDALDVAKRAQVPIGEVKKLQVALLAELHKSLGYAAVVEEQGGVGHDGEASGPATQKATTGNAAAAQSPPAWQMISTLDEGLDTALGGGIPTGYLTEIAGESGVGKTQFLLTLLLAAQLPSPAGVSRSSIYISTEAALSTRRLAQILQDHPRFADLSAAEKPSLKRILSMQTPDLESQEHILKYQVPVAIERHDVGLVVLDSVAANYRAEFEKDEGSGQKPRNAAAAMAQRSVQLTQLGSLLRELAQKYNIAVVVANQVADRFSPADWAASSAGPSRNTSYNSQASNGHAPTTPRVEASRPQFVVPERTVATPLALTTSDPMALDHQQRWFTGWGDVPENLSATGAEQNLKTPSLGLVWTNQLACRIALIKQPVYSRPNALNDLIQSLEAQASGRNDDGDQSSDLVRWKRWMKVVFAPWVAPTAGNGLEFEIKGSGIRAMSKS